MIASKRLYHLCLLFCGMFFIGLFFLATPQTTLAVSQVSGYQITATESSSTMTLGGDFPTLRAHLTVPADEPAMNPANFYFLIDNQSYAGSVSGSNPDYTLFLNGGPGAVTLPLSVGDHTIAAAYYSPKLNTTLKSTALPLTIVKASPFIVCTIVNWANTYKTTSSLTIRFDFGQSNVPTELQNAAYVIKFEGAQTVTRTNLTLNSADTVTVLTPSIPDNYKLHCVFNGSASFSAADVISQNSPMIVSSNHAVGGIHLSTNPQTVKAGQTTTYQIVIAAAPGLPTPTGRIALFIGSSYTNTIALGAGGSITFQATSSSPLPGTNIKVAYYGDTVYISSSATFSLTNPSGPTSQPSATPASSGTATSTPGSSVTPTGTAIGTATGTPITSATSTSTPTTSNLAGTHTPGSPTNPGVGTPWIWPALLTVAIIGLIGGATAFFLLRRRAILSKISTHKYPVIHQ